MGLAIERPTLEIFFGAIVDYAPAQNHQVHRLRYPGMVEMGICLFMYVSEQIGGFGLNQNLSF